MKHDISQYHALKSTLEQILGKDAWNALKQCTSLAEWKRYINRLLSAMLVSTRENIVIFDASWMVEVEDPIEQGKNLVKSAKSINEVFAVLSTTLTKLVFLQIGCIPSRRGVKKVSLSRENWKLNCYRSVQYVQSKGQVESLRWNVQQRTIGFQKQMEFKEQHRISGSKLSFFEWCEKHEGIQDN